MELVVISDIILLNMEEIFVIYQIMVIVLSKVLII